MLSYRPCLTFKVLYLNLHTPTSTLTPAETFHSGPREANVKIITYLTLRLYYQYSVSSSSMILLSRQDHDYYHSLLLLSSLLLFLTPG